MSNISGNKYITISLLKVVAKLTYNHTWIFPVGFFYKFVFHICTSNLRIHKCKTYQLCNLYTTLIYYSLCEMILFYSGLDLDRVHCIIDICEFDSVIL